MNEKENYVKHRRYIIISEERENVLTDLLEDMGICNYSLVAMVNDTNLSKIVKDLVIFEADMATYKMVLDILDRMAITYGCSRYGWT